MPAPNRKLIPLAKSLAVSLKPAEVAELTRMAAADGCPRVSKWIVKQIREKIIQEMPIESGIVAGSTSSPETEAQQDPPPVSVVPHSPQLNRSWASLGLDERKAKAAEWGVKPPEGWGTWTPEERTLWLDATYPLSPLADKEEAGW